MCFSGALPPDQIDALRESKRLEAGLLFAFIPLQAALCIAARGGGWKRRWEKECLIYNCPAAAVQKGGLSAHNTTITALQTRGCVHM